MPMDMSQQNNNVIAVFDIGKINKRFYLFDSWLNLVHTDERIFEEIRNNDGQQCEDIAEIRRWMHSCLLMTVREGRYSITMLNVTSARDTLESLREHDNEIIFYEDNGFRFSAGGGTDETTASLVPYIKGTDRPFILVSTGAWCKFINPFNDEPLSDEQQQNGRVSLINVNGQEIKSSQLLLGIIHDSNVARLDDRFGVTGELYKTIRIRSNKIGRLMAGGPGRIFFRKGIPPGYVDNEADLSRFLTYADAYHQMVYDLVDVCLESYRQIIAANDCTEIVYVTGGFAWNDTFVRILAARLPDKRVFASRIENPTALGAAMTVFETAFGTGLPSVYLGLKAIINND